MTLSRDRLTTVLLAAAYVAAYTVVYADILVPTYGYEGLAYLPPSFERLWALRLAAVLPALWLPTALVRPSQIAYWLIYLFVLVPIQFVPIYSRVVDPDEFLIFVATATAAFGLIGGIYRVRLMRLPSLRANSTLYWALLILTGSVMFAVFFASGEFRPRLVGLYKVYDVRAEYTEAAARGNKLIPYAISWQGNVIDPLFMAHGLVKRRTWMVIAGVVGQVALYSITAYKSMLFSTVIFLCILLAMRAKRGQFGRLLLVGVLGIFGAVMLVTAAGVSTPMVASLLDRVIGVPGLLTGYYFDFFSHHQKALLGDGVLSALVDYRYAFDVPHLIGDVYFHAPRMSANANFWADGYANFGYYGMIMSSVLLGVILWGYDCISREVDIRVAGLMIAIPTLAVANCGLQTTLVTHGLGFAALLLMLYPRDSASGDQPGAAARPPSSIAPPSVV